MGKITQNQNFWRRLIVRLRSLQAAVLTLAISTGLLVVLTNFQVNAVLREQGTGNREQGRNIQVSNSVPIVQKSHPLPPTLAQWQDKTNSGDYFDQIKSTKVGYLIWSSFPVKVKIETPTDINEKQSQIWVNSVSQAVQEWSIYLPLQVVEKLAIADITISRKAPPLQREPNGKILRSRSALTTYDLYTENNILSHRFTILLSPSQTGDYVLSAARHELGHALGIWGHSFLETDTMYFSQVRKPPFISVRDVNTLKRVYEQSTSLGQS
ncbi:peptidase [Dolichospermum sp. UHCC 0259]|uniref:peptidase n=1 Tax=Dolichospermum sp. UHCC 0259 TaxID=2590010 RepID=UPI0014486BA2|nr:peptidase [Dolichospermum sp. UHCC 0259]MTJ48567.1 peptidase [Dolichospermum sp. UHCC 0259]